MKFEFKGLPPATFTFRVSPEIHATGQEGTSQMKSGTQVPTRFRAHKTHRYLEALIRRSYSSTSRFGWFLCVFGRAQLGPGSVKTSLPKLLDALGAKKALAATGNSLYNKVLHRLITKSQSDRYHKNCRRHTTISQHSQHLSSHMIFSNSRYRSRRPIVQRHAGKYHPHYRK